MSQSSNPPANLTGSTPHTTAGDHLVIPIVILLGILSIVSSAYYWQIHFFFLRLNYFHDLVSWSIAEKTALFLCGLSLVFCFIFTMTKLRSNRRRHRVLWFIAVAVIGIGAPFLAVPLFLWGLLLNPVYQTRDGLHALNTVYIRTQEYRMLADDNVTQPPPQFKKVFDECILTGLPPVNAASPAAPALIIAYSKKTFPDTGVVDYSDLLHRYIYFKEGRAVSFADGRADFVSVSEFPALFAVHNAARATLGLPPQTLDDQPMLPGAPGNPGNAHEAEVPPSFQFLMEPARVSGGVFQIPPEKKTRPILPDPAPRPDPQLLEIHPPVPTTAPTRPAAP
jgi:hypothetical protein